MNNLYKETNMKTSQKHLKYSCLIIFILAINSVFGQTLKQDKMKDLSFMIGEWIGVSTIYKNGTIDKQVSAFQKIKYDLDKNIIVIDLHSELLQLHTIIYFDDKDNKYYYNPYSKSSSRRLPAEYKDGKFIVTANENTRYIFNKTVEGGFQEYGERFENGKWVKFFEDNFKNTE